MASGMPAWSAGTFRIRPSAARTVPAAAGEPRPSAVSRAATMSEAGRRIAAGTRGGGESLPARSVTEVSPGRPRAPRRSLRPAQQLAEPVGVQDGDAELLCPGELGAGP